MPQQVFASVLSNEEIIADHKVLVCEAPAIAALAQPGHFVNVLTAERTDPLLRKPFSIYTVDRERGQISLLYSIVGATTIGMSRKRPGDTLDLVGPLGGRIFQPDTRPGATHILVGGGYGVPPLVFLARELHLAPTKPDLVFIIGARRKDLLLCEAELTAAGVDARAATEDGSHGTQGRVTDVLAPLLAVRSGRPVTVYCCGPTPMMRAVGDLCQSLDVPCQLSVEVAMPCGIGVCMGCVLDLTDGRRVRCCVDGPVFEASEVAW
ncbi:MAG: dihydroorotate dehydrogenase electron transfer subunit [Janthinobacterium lividum]